MKKKITTIIIGITFIWVGMICGISFLEAPLKFQAPGITLPLGLGIGKLVFGALTKVEMLFAVVIVAGLLLNEFKINIWAFFLIPIIIVTVDNAFLMPILDHRTEMIISGAKVPNSNVHWIYVILEAIKFLTLIVAGIKVTNHVFAMVPNNQPQV